MKILPNYTILNQKLKGMVRVLFALWRDFLAFIKYFEPLKNAFVKAFLDIRKRGVPFGTPDALYIEPLVEWLEKLMSVHDQVD